MSERDRTPQVRVEKRKPTIKAAHRCSVCNVKVDDPLDDDAHVCVPDDKGPIKVKGKSWRAATARDARR